MNITPFKLNLYMFYKLPSAFWCGVRAKTIEAAKCEATVTYKWFNQNPFKSMYFAVQCMAAEFTTGALVLYHIQKSNANISMLVSQNKAVYHKKAVGKIKFSCQEGSQIENVILNAIETKDGQTIWLTSIGTNSNGETVSEMQFEWSLKVRN